MRRAQPSAGYSLVELLFVMGLLGILAGAAVPQVAAGMDRARAQAAARYLAAQMAFARTRAVGRGATVALRFQGIGADNLRVSMIADGNRNGVRARDVDAGLDREIQAPVRLQDLFPGVAIDVPAGADDSGVQIGGSEMLSFTPAGTATSGSINVLGRDGSRFAIRVLGVTGRVRVQRYDATAQAWVDSW